MRTIALVLHTAAHSGPARNFASRFRDGADRLHVYAPREGPALDGYRDFAEIHLAPYRRLVMPRSARSLAGALAGHARDAATFRRLFRVAGVDTVVCATTVTPAAALAARGLGLRCVVYCGELFQTGSRGRRLSARAMAASVPRLADLVVCASDRVAAQFTKDARARVVRLYPPIARAAPGGADQRAVRAALGLALDRPVVLTMGTLSPGRGQDVAIAAFDLLRSQPASPVLAIAGAAGDADSDARYVDELRGQVAQLGLGASVRFLGSASDVSALMAAADVFVNPARVAEAFGRAALEALAHGVPAVVTSTGAQTELLSDGRSALVVPPDDPEALARAVARLLDSPELGPRLVEGAAPLLETLDPDADRARFRELLDGLG